MLGRFASMRNDYLRENKPVLYEQMIREGRKTENASGRNGYRSPANTRTAD